MSPLRSAALLLCSSLAGALLVFGWLSTQTEALPPVVHHEFSGRAFGTTYRVAWNENLSAEKAERLRASIEANLAAIDARISVYRPDSLLVKLNASRSMEPVKSDGFLVTLILQAQELKKESGGAFDPSVLPLLKVWGFGPYPRRSTLPTPTEIFEARQRLRDVEVVFPPPSGFVDTLRKSHADAELDLSALGEGLGLQSMASAADSHGLKNYYLEFGGEMFARGNSVKGRPWRVGIERPEPGSTELWCVVELNNVGVSTSGSYRNFVEIDGKQYSHLIDPRSGAPIDHNGLSVSVIHAEPVQADGWSTALMVLGPEKGFELARKKKLAALFIYKENGALKAKQTPEFEAYMVRESK